MARFEELETFVRVVEAGGISAAAEHMGIAKSAVSRRISDLEARLGAQLFRRTTRRFTLTDAAQDFYRQCLRLLADLEDAEQAVTQSHGTLSGRLRVAVPLSFGLLHLGPAIDAFSLAHPQLSFDLDFNDRQVDLVAEGFDLALRIGELADSSLVARRLATMRIMVAASPAYLEQHGKPQTPRDLAQHTCMTYSNLPDPYAWTWLDAQGKAETVRVASGLQANNGDFLCQAAAAGHGITRQPTFILYRYIEAGTLVPILADYTWPAVNAWAVYPRTRHVSQRVRAFIDFLAERFAGVPYWDRRLSPQASS